MENKYLARAKQLRNHPAIRYNCAQALLVTFADACGISEEKAFQLGTHFGGGMKMAATCGAITSGLMVIGMMGGGDSQRQAFVSAMRDGHGGLMDCADLLKKNKEMGGERKPHCDGMIYEAVSHIVRIMELL